MSRRPRRLSLCRQHWCCERPSFFYRIAVLGSYGRSSRSLPSHPPLHAGRSQPGRPLTPMGGRASKVPLSGTFKFEIFSYFANLLMLMKLSAVLWLIRTHVRAISPKGHGGGDFCKALVGGRFLLTSATTRGPMRRMAFACSLSSSCAAASGAEGSRRFRRRQPSGQLSWHAACFPISRWPAVSAQKKRRSIAGEPRACSVWLSQPSLAVT